MTDKPHGILSHRAALPALIAVVLAGLYTFTMSEHVSLEDSGEFIIVSNYAGIAHPPGYPLYTMLGKLFTLIPVDNIAFRVKFLSALAGAFSGVFIYLCCIALSRERWTAFLCAIFFGVCGLPWGLSLVAEVYTLHGLFYFLLLYIALRLYRNFNSREFYLWTFLFGLSLSHHLPLTILGAISLFPLLFGKDVRRRIFFVMSNTPYLTGVFVLGLLPYLYIVIRSYFDPYFAAFGPVSPGELPAYVLRSQYASLHASPTATLTDSFFMLAYFLKEYFLQTGIAGAILVAAGIIAAVFSASGRVVKFSLFAGFITTPAILLLLLNFDYDILRKQAYMFYQIAPFGIGAIFLSFALPAAGKFASAKWQVMSPVSFSIAIGAFVCIVTFASNFGANNMRGNSMAFDYSKAVLESMPQNAALFLYADTDLSPVSYTRLIAEVRPDVRLYSSFSHLFGNRLYKPDGNPSEAKGKLRQFLQKEKRLFFTFQVPEFKDFDGAVIRDHGIFFEVSLSETDPPVAVESELLNSFLDRHLNDRYEKIWTYHRRIIVGRFCRALLLRGETHPIFEKHPGCKNQKAIHLARDGKHKQATVVFRELFDDYKDGIKRERVKLYELYAWSSIQFINAIQPEDSGEKLQLFQKLADDIRPSVFIVPSCGNEVLKYLLLIGSQINVDIGFNGLRERFGRCQNLRPLFKKTARRIREAKNPREKNPAITPGSIFAVSGVFRPLRPAVKL